MPHTQQNKTTIVVRIAALTLAERVLLRWLTMEERKQALLDAARAKAQKYARGGDDV